MRQGNLTNPKAQRHLRNIADLRVSQEQEDLRFLLSTGAGRRFLSGLIIGSGLFLKMFTGGSETFFRDGRRSIGLELAEQIQRLAPERWLEMEAERLKDQQDEDLQRQVVLKEQPNE